MYEAKQIPANDHSINIRNLSNSSTPATPTTLTTSAIPVVTTTLSTTLSNSTLAKAILNDLEKFEGDPTDNSNELSDTKVSPPRPIVSRSNGERRGTKPRNLYAVKVYNRRVGQRRAVSP